MRRERLAHIQRNRSDYQKKQIRTSETDICKEKDSILGFVKWTISKSLRLDVYSCTEIESLIMEYLAKRTTIKRQEAE